jgi:ion channel-forming bestrophin family protein
MINYNPKTWFGQIIDFPKSDTLRILWQEIVIISLYTWGLSYLLITHAPNLSAFKNTLSVHSLVGFVMGLFLVFRTNTAYDRWWEGRKQWGALVNASRNVSMKIDAFFSEQSSGLKDEILALIAAFPTACKDHLRQVKNLQELQLSEEFTNRIKDKKHIPNAIATEIYKKIKIARDKNYISGDELIILDNELNELTDIIGACERIQSTPIPYSYSLFMKKFIFIYAVSLPVGLIPDFKYWSIPVTIFVFYIMVSLEILAEEIEDPFGFDENDLPTDEIAQKIRANITEITEK